MDNKLEQLKKVLNKAHSLEQGKELVLAKELLDINEKQEETLQAIKDIPEADPFPTKMRVELEGVDVITLKGLDGHTPTEDELQSLIKPLIPEPIKGDSYVLTKNDKVEIASLIKVPVVEKVETVREIPVITNEIIEVAVSDEPIIIKEKLESLKDEERLDISAIKGVEKSNNTLSDTIINRAIGIVDQRTSFLINKVSNLSTQVSQVSATTTTNSVDFISGFFEAPTNKEYKLVVKIPYAGTISSITTVSVSGSCTLTGYINATPLGGIANQVSSSERSENHSTANVFASGDDIMVKVTSNSSCIDMSVTIVYTRT